jgi:hypothetical protein
MHHLPDIAAWSLWYSVLKVQEVFGLPSYGRNISVIPVF